MTLDCKGSSQLKGQERPLWSSDIWVDTWTNRQTNAYEDLDKRTPDRRETSTKGGMKLASSRKRKMACMVRVERVVESAVMGGDDRESDRKQIRQGLMGTGGGQD